MATNHQGKNQMNSKVFEANRKYFVENKNVVKLETQYATGNKMFCFEVLADAQVFFLHVDSPDHEIAVVEVEKWIAKNWQFPKMYQFMSGPWA
jgi:hypothetical protein